MYFYPYKRVVTFWVRWRPRYQRIPSWPSRQRHMAASVTLECHFCELICAILGLRLGSGPPKVPHGLRNAQNWDLSKNGSRKLKGNHEIARFWPGFIKNLIQWPPKNDRRSFFSPESGSPCNFTPIDVLSRSECVEDRATNASHHDPHDSATWPRLSH